MLRYRWCEVAAIPAKSAEHVHRFIMQLVFRFGACQILLHDQGREFNNTLVGDLCKQLETTETMTSAYHPETNGLTGTLHMRAQLSHNRHKHAAYSHRLNGSSSHVLTAISLSYGKTKNSTPQNQNP